MINGDIGTISEIKEVETSADTEITERDGNLYFLEQEGGTHSGEYAIE
jgi:hypothetical protein